MHVTDCSYAPILRFFSSASDGATATAKFRTAFFDQFFYKFEEG